MIHLGTRIRAERLAKDWTQQDLAHYARLSIRTVSKIEATGNGHLSTLAAIAKALGIEPHELLTAQEAAS